MFKGFATIRKLFSINTLLGMVDLPEDNREAAMNAITLPEVKSYSSFSELFVTTRV